MNARFCIKAIISLCLISFLLTPLSNATPDAWVSPTGFEDPTSTWSDEPKAYDEDINTDAYAINPSVCQWTGFLVLTIDSIYSNWVRYYIKTPYFDVMDDIDIDVYRDGSWIDVFQGSIIFDQWVNKSFTAGYVTKARIRIHAILSLFGINFNEFDFWETEAPPIKEWHDVTSWNFNLTTRQWTSTSSWSFQLIGRQWQNIISWSFKLIVLGWHEVVKWIFDLTTSKTSILFIGILIIGLILCGIIYIAYKRKKV